MLKAINLIVFGFILCCLAVPIPAFSAPASPMSQFVTQPDGSTFTAMINGDEYQRFVEDAYGNGKW